MRLLEGVIFCCLAGVMLYWIADRLRSLDFEPVVVTPCSGAACAPYDGPDAGRHHAVYTDALEPDGVTTFSSTNLCLMAADLVQSKGTEAAGVDLILTHMTARGVIAFVQGDGASVAMIPGARNDSWDDVLRDAVRLAPSRGCFPMNYRPVFWPLLLSWLLLASVRLFRAGGAIRG